MNKIILSIFFVLFFILSCNKADDPDLIGVDFKQEMRNFIIKISDYSRQYDNDFIIIPQNGQELITESGDEHGKADLNYVNAIDGHGREDLNFGYSKDNKATPTDEMEYIDNFLKIGYDKGIVILVTDYCSDHDKMDDSYLKNLNKGYISFAASHRELDNIPDYPATPYNENNNVISNLSEAKNFLYLINPENFNTKQDFINSITSTNYDLIIMDYFFNENIEFTKEEVIQLKNKSNGGKRLVVSYLSIGEAEDYRYYWQENWNKNEPDWLYEENPDWEGNFKVKYWKEDWQKIIFSSEDAYLDKIIDKGFDGVYLDIIDAFEYFEEL